MAECPVCGRIINGSDICTECGYDRSIDYERYPTIHMNLGDNAKTISFYREEYKKNNPEDVFTCSACGGKEFMYRGSKGSLICCDCYKEYAQASDYSVSEYYSEGVAPVGRLSWELQKKFHRINENDVMTIKVYDDVTYAISRDGSMNVYNNRDKQIVSDGALGTSVTYKNIKYITRKDNNMIFLGLDGSVDYIGGDNIIKNIKGWKNITAISSSNGYVLGLKEDGRVLVAGAPLFNVKDNEIEGFEDIIAISAGSTHAVGLRKNGTVVAVGLNNLYGHCETGDWKDIIAISAGEKHTLGLKSDGTVVSTGIKDPALDHGQCQTDHLKDIVAISAGKDHSVFLNKDGQVFARGDNSHGQCEIRNFYDIVAISAYGDKTAALRADGKVIFSV